MPSTFPGVSDVFGVPSDPVNTPLGSVGDSDRKHAAHHADLGDALEAMQAQQTLLAHSHDGATFRHGQKLIQANTHQSADTDSSTSALHHTIGSGANQYASGTHTHAAVVTYPVGAFFFGVVSTNPSSLGVVGTWTAVGQRFLCATGGALGFSGGDVGGSNTHSHTIDASTDTISNHTHTLTTATTGSTGGHGHTGGSVNSGGVSHTHSLGSHDNLSQAIIPSGSTSWINDPHTHTSASASASHTHTSSSITSGAGVHTHNVTDSTPSAGGSHSHTNSTPSTTNNLVPLLVVYMWKRTA